MMEEKILIEKMQGKYSNYIKKYSLCLTKPELRFLKESCYGILSSQSCIVRKTAQKLKEKISSKKTQERLVYHLDKEDLSNRLYQTHLNNQCRQLKKESLIIVDPSDLVKEYATKMEGLSKVRDGNDGKWKQGYNALDIVGINRDGNDVSVLPLHSQIHSKVKDIDTMKNMLFDRIIDILIYSNNQGTFVFDREFDDKKLIGHLNEHDASYIIRMRNNRNLYFEGEKQNIKSIAKSTKLKYRFEVQKESTIKAGISKVGLPLNPHSVKNPILAEAILVVAKIKSRDKHGRIRSGMFYFLCKLKDNKLPKRELIQYVLESYRLRWKIEEVHRQIKNDYGWEKIKLQNYNRLQNMNTILWIAISFLYSLDRWKYLLVKTFAYIMTERKKLSELKHFIYYKLTSIIQYCFNKVSLYRKVAVSTNKKNPLQLCIPWF